MESAKSKVLLMGKAGSGKTSMRSIIFANYVAKDTDRLGATIEVEHSQVKLLGNLTLNLWDCGGQNGYRVKYLEKDNMFVDVQVLIYVIDIEDREPNKEIGYFKDNIEALYQNSRNAKVFVLIHKFDVIPEDSRDSVFRKKEMELQQAASPVNITCFRTSIWDETLFRAWSAIVYSLIPNIKTIEANLDNFTKITGADETVIFEKATFLVIAHSSRKDQSDPHRFEKISNIIKQFKLSCNNARTQFASMEVKSSKFLAFIEGFTSNSIIMVIVSDPKIESATIQLNVKIARKHFEKIVNKTNEKIL